jgi:hypothetical protein
MMKVLLVSHSSRPFVDDRVSLNSLERRFGERRLTTLPPIKSFPDVTIAVPFTGALTIWCLENSGRLERLRLGAVYKPDFKIQSAAFHGDSLVVYGADRLEILDQSLTVLRTIRHPWLVGGHTIYLDKRGHAWLTSAPANAVFRLDLESGAILETLPMPDQYGPAYPIDDKLDLSRHFVPTDSQSCHVNCAYPSGDSIVVSALIPGTVGVFDRERHYRELVRGFRGLHGGKIDPTSGKLYFTDSTGAAVYFIDPENGSIVARIGIASGWVHDAEVVNSRLLAVTVGDENEIRLVDRQSGDIIARRHCRSFGETVMFVSAAEAPSSWEAVLTAADDGLSDELTADTPIQAGQEYAPALLNYLDWASSNPVALEQRYEMRSRTPISSEYLATVGDIELPAGEYQFSASIDCRAGRVSLGIAVADDWLIQLYAGANNHSVSGRFTIDTPSSVSLVIAGANIDGPAYVDISILWLSLRRLGSD